MAGGTASPRRMKGTKMSTSVRRTLEVAALAAVLASTATLAVSAIVTAPLSVAPLDQPHTQWVGMPCSEADRRTDTIYIGSGTYTGPYACIQVAATMADLAPRSLTPAEVAAQTPSQGPIPPCSATSLPFIDCAAAPVTPPKLTGADLPAGTTIRVRTASGEIQTCSHSKGGWVSAGGWVSDGGVPVSGDDWNCSRLTPPKFVPSTSHRDQ